MLSCNSVLSTTDKSFSVFQRQDAHSSCGANGSIADTVDLGSRFKYLAIPRVKWSALAENERRRLEAVAIPNMSGTILLSNSTMPAHF